VEAYIHSCALGGPYMQEADQIGYDEAASDGNQEEVDPSFQGHTDALASCAGILAVHIQDQQGEAG
jgi:hypothetical protein